MKIGSTALKKTQTSILNATRRGGAFTAAQVARWMWPLSRQLPKKTATISGHLRRLERMGYTRMVGHGVDGELWVNLGKTPAARIA